MRSTTEQLFNSPELCFYFGPCLCTLLHNDVHPPLASAGCLLSAKQVRFSAKDAFSVSGDLQFENGEVVVGGPGVIFYEHCLTCVNDDDDVFGQS